MAEDGGTFLEAVERALDGAVAFNAMDEVAPVALLWPDEAGEWGPLLRSPLTRWRRDRPLYALGPRDPAAKSGGAAYLRCMVEWAPPNVWAPGIVPVLHLPGYPAGMLLDHAGGGGGLPSPPAGPLADIAILTDLRHRGAVWARPDGRDWSVAAFLEEIGVEVRPDAATRQALRRALPLLAGVSLARLRGDAPWRAADFDALAGLPAAAKEPDLAELIAAGESAGLEFKSTIRWDVKQGKENKDLELMVLKTIAAFLNAEGGTLLIGVADDGTVLGLERDQTLICREPRNWDKLERHLLGLCRNHVGDALLAHVRVRFHLVDGRDVCRVTVAPAPEPAYVTEKGVEQFYVRAGNATGKLGLREAVRYVRHHWT